MNNSTPLGRLEQVDLRQAWLSESADFTPWLVKEENLSLLADTLGMDLELEAKEKEVGPYRADIVCKDTTDATLVYLQIVPSPWNNASAGAFRVRISMEHVALSASK